MRKLLNANPTTTQTNAALLMIRLVLGVIFVAHGGQKVFVYGMSAISGGFAGMGIPLAGVMGPVVSVFELVGGAAILVGLLTRVVGAGLVLTMAGAIGFAHISSGFFAPNGIEFPLMLLGASAALVLTGAGAWSLDAVLTQRTGKVTEPAVVRSGARAAA